ncbi:MAG: hydantoinase/oxoprolinase family protein [Proteobacteria bacterium]|nr:hydantoinase/oxoprolinase family protein [Pseudomonadota bacterium]
MSAAIGLGIDVGGTNTDAVLIDLAEKKVLSFAKAPTTRADLTLGIAESLRGLEKRYFPGIALIGLSTTLATNAIVEGARRRVLGILIGYGPDDFPPALREDAVLIRGGHDVRGEEREPLDTETLRDIVQKKKGEIEASAVCGYFSVRNPDHELRAGEIIRQLTGRPVVCGHELSLQLDAVKRATTTILNAHLIPVIHHLVDSVKKVFLRNRITAPLMIVRGDGSLMGTSAMMNRPIETILSGPAASVIGARYLLEQEGVVENAVIVDIGGTTTDTALLRNGAPCLNPEGARIGSWQTNVQAIDIRTIGLGGDSQVSLDDNGNLRVGPKRIIPIAFLGAEHPEIEAELERIRARRDHLPLHIAPDFWVALGKNPEGDEERAGRRIQDLLGKGPRSLLQLFEAADLGMTDVQREMARLEKKGLVQHCGITPTDFLHANGTFAAWNRETALLALQILCDRHRISFPALSEKLAEVMERKMGLQILDLVLAERVRLHRDQDGCNVCSVFWDQCFSREKRSDHVQFQISLKNRLVGIGAPAHAFLPPVAQKLGTSAIVPFHAGVANAIGAITGAVAMTDEALIRPVQGQFRLHYSHGVEVFAGLEEATVRGRNLLAEVIREKAGAAGAGDVEVTLEEKEHWATSRGGDSLFMEKRLIARAIGSPRLEPS